VDAARDQLSGLSLVEVVEIQALDEILERGHSLDLLGTGRLPLLGNGGALLLVEQNAGAIEHGLLGEDRDTGADRQSDGVAWSRVDLDLTAADVEDDVSVEGVVREVVDDDRRDLASERFDERLQQIVGQRSRSASRRTRW